MKSMLQALARRFGYEIKRRSGPMRVASMETGLAWLGGLGLDVGTVLDVGASDGRWTKQCRVQFPAAQYVLYEPNPVHEAALDELLRTAPHPTFVERAAVGNACGTAPFNISDPFGGGLVDRGSDDDVPTIEVPVVTLDDSVRRLGVPDPYLVKLDTHGFERGILSGARRVLEASAVLIIEAYNHRLTSEGMYFWELCDLLHQLDFRPVDLVDVMHREVDGSLWQMDLLFLRSTWSGFANSSYR